MNATPFSLPQGPHVIQLSDSQGRQQHPISLSSDQQPHPEPQPQPQPQPQPRPQQPRRSGRVKRPVQHANVSHQQPRRRDMWKDNDRLQAQLRRRHTGPMPHSPAGAVDYPEPGQQAPTELFRELNATCGQQHSQWRRKIPQGHPFK